MTARGRLALVLALLTATATLPVAWSAACTKHHREPVDRRLRASVTVDHLLVHASPGPSSLYEPEIGIRVQTDVRTPIPLSGRLPVRAGERLAVHLAVPATSVRATLATPRGEALTRPENADEGTRARVWFLTLPARLPRRADRLNIGVDYPDTSIASFQAGIRVARRR
jgi:hypothetical protein